MIVYNPLDGEPLSSYRDTPRHCFLMTRLGEPVPSEVTVIREFLTGICADFEYSVIDANTQVTGRDFLLKIWKLIAATPLSIAIIHEDIPETTLENIYYEIGVAQALGKETLLVKCVNSNIPSDFVRSEYIIFDNNFDEQFRKFMRGLSETASHYEIMGDNLENNPVLALDYYRRAFLLNNNDELKRKARELLAGAGLKSRAKNSVELLIATFAQD